MDKDEVDCEILQAQHQAWQPTTDQWQPTTDQWHHYAMSWAATGICQFIIDGIMVANKTLVNTPGLYILSGGSWTMGLDQVKCYYWCLDATDGLEWDD